MTTACYKESCASPVATYGLCDKHYRQALHAGEYGLRDTSRALAKIQALVDLGWHGREIAEAAGVHVNTVYRIRKLKTDKARVDIVDAIASLPLMPPPDRGLIASIGVRRRLQALYRLGWTLNDIARESGIPRRTLTWSVYQRTVSARIASAVEATYRRLENVLGPSRLTSRRAALRMLAPPAAWDYIDIDDPAAEPQGVRRVA